MTSRVAREGGTEYNIKAEENKNAIYCNLQLTQYSTVLARDALST